MADALTFTAAKGIPENGRDVGVRHELAFLADASSPSNDATVSFPVSGILGNIRLLHAGTAPTDQTKILVYAPDGASSNQTTLLTGLVTTAASEDDSLAFKSDGKPLDFACHGIITVAVTTNSVNSGAMTIYLYVYYLIR